MKPPLSIMHLTALLCCAVTGATAEPQYGSADFQPTPQRPINFRGDPTGGYPGANPPIRFGEQENLRWKVNVGQGCGSAMVVGSRVFVQAAPNALVCLDRATGKELWRRDKHVGQLDPKSTAAQCDGLMDQIGATHVRYQQLHLKMTGMSDKSPERIALQAEMKKVEESLPNRKGPLGVPGSPVDGYGSCGIYLIIMTPCSDGRTVVAVFPTGIAVAYDLQGTWLWSTSVRTPTDVPKDWPPGRYLQPPGVCLNTCPVFTREGIVVVVYGLVTYGIETQSGKIRWKQANGGESNASPVLGVIGSESFIANGNGDIMRVRDGFLVYRGSGPGGTCSVSPVFADGVFHWVTSAVKVVPGDLPKAEVLWSLTPEIMNDKFKCKSCTYKKPYLSGDVDFTSPVIIGNRLLYYSPRGNRLMSVLEATTGKILTQYNIDTDKIKSISGKNGTHGGHGLAAYGGMVRAGDLLIVPHSNGVVKIISINETFSPVQVCPMPDSIYGQPTCDGSDLYLRSVNTLWCFENKTPRSDTGPKPSKDGKL